MNIRFSILLIVLSVLLALPAVAQNASTASPAHQGNASASTATSGTSASSTGTSFPNEKSLLIGAPAKGATVKPVKSLGAWDYIQMVLVLALVVAGIYLLFYFLKRVGGPKHQENTMIGVLSTKVLQPNRSLHLVDVGGQLFLVGTSENSVNLVASIDDKEAIDEIRLRSSQTGAQAERRSFRDAFAGAFRKGIAGGPGIGGSVMESMGFLKQQRERLKKM